MAEPLFRVGLGYDLHPFVAGRRLVLGGVEIPWGRGLAGFSDADALLHAVMDAILGAAGMGDIGQRFPAGEERYRDADSKILLEETLRLVRSAGWEVVNIDSVIIAQEPPLAPYLPAMRQRVAVCTGTSEDRVNIKAKWPEGLGALGRGEGIAAEAVALLYKASTRGR